MPETGDDSLMAMADQLAGAGEAADDDVPWHTGPEPVLQSPEPEPAPDPSPAVRPAPADPVPPEPEQLANGEGFVWPRDFRKLAIVGMPGNLASQGACEQQGRCFVLTLDEGHYRLLTERHQQKILEGLRRAFGDDVTLEVRAGAAGDQTPIAWEAREKARRQQQAEQAIEQDPLVQAIVERFEGRVVKDSIRPLENPAG